MHDRGWPEEGELVVCTVKDVKDFAAFVTLDEYSGREGLIHISEVAKGWIKHIRDFVREGQKVVCKVLNVNPERGHIDLSLKDVNEHQRREKIQEWKNEVKARKWIGFAAESAGVSPAEIEEKIYQRYGILYPAFEEILLEGDPLLKEMGFENAVRKALLDIASENVKISKVEIAGHLILTTSEDDGINTIRRALRSAQPKVEDVEIELKYIGAPKYRIKITAPNYKLAEDAIEKAANAAIGVMERVGGTGKFIRKQKSGKSA